MDEDKLPCQLCGHKEAKFFQIGNIPYAIWLFLCETHEKWFAKLEPKEVK